MSPIKKRKIDFCFSAHFSLGVMSLLGYLPAVQSLCHK